MRRVRRMVAGTALAVMLVGLAACPASTGNDATSLSATQIGLKVLIVSADAVDLVAQTLAANGVIPAAVAEPLEVFLRSIKASAQAVLAQIDAGTITAEAARAQLDALQVKYDKNVDIPAVMAVGMARLPNALRR
jgi:hypothetical protein